MSAEKPLDVLHDALYGENLSEHTRGLIRHRMESALENERAAIRQECFVAMLHSMKAAVDEQYDWRDGSDPSDDAPKAGSKMRPGEGLTAGAAWLQDWRLP